MKFILGISFYFAIKYEKLRLTSIRFFREKKITILFAISTISSLVVSVDMRLGAVKMVMTVAFLYTFAQVEPTFEHR